MLGATLRRGRLATSKGMLNKRAAKKIEQKAAEITKIFCN
jgi:hypothetical protein